MPILPTGFQLRAARSLIGWQQKDLARHANLHVGTLNRMEKSGKNRVTGSIANLEAALAALEKHGVRITETGVELTAKRNR